jgi:hypothetical protein
VSTYVPVGPAYAGWRENIWIAFHGRVTARSKGAREYYDLDHRLSIIIHELASRQNISIFCVQQGIYSYI